MTRGPGSATVAAMLALVEAVIGAFYAAFRPRARLVAENLALRQQLAALVRDRPRARLGPIDRAFWVVLSSTWSRWAEVLAIVKPATVIEWHRCGRPPSTTWGTFLRTHLAGTIAIDFLTVPTVTFNVRYVFFVLSLERRRILHVNVNHCGLRKKPATIGSSEKAKRCRSS